jgi:hypothetical protein
MRQQFWFRAFFLSIFICSLGVGRAQVTAVKLNELLASEVNFINWESNATDVLELFNTSFSDVFLDGCSLSDSNTSPRRYVFPPNSRIPARGFYRLAFDSSGSSNETHVPFGIRASGGFFYLFDPGLGLIDSLEYGLQAADLSLGRVPDGTGAWRLTAPTFGNATTVGGANVPVTLGPHSALRVNEWMANNSGGADDYFEIFNTTNRPLDISGIFLTDQAAAPTKFRVPNLSFIGTGSISGILMFEADNVNTNTQRYPADHVNFSLSNNGEAVGIYGTDGFTSIDFITFGSQTNGISEGRLPDGAGPIGIPAGHANRVYFPKINDYDTASPAEPNFLLFTNLYINELLAHTDPPLEDAIEFINTSPGSINISGWWLSNSRLDRKRYQVPSGPAIVPGGYRVVYEGTLSTVGFNSSAAHVPFTFNSAHGDQAVLSQVDANGNLTGWIVFEEFEASANSISFGHYNTSVSNDYKFVALSSPTFGVNDPISVAQFRAGVGQKNSAPRVGPLVINEIMFAPSNTVYLGTNSIIVTNQNPAEEYIEVRNITTTTTVPLYDPQYPTNRWRLQRAIEFAFPLVSLAPNEFCLVVGFNPLTEPAALANFRARFNVSNNVPVFGPWTGRLSDAGDAVELYRPDPPQGPQHPDFGFVPYIRIDKVNYNSAPPWPGGANGTGLSLQRKNSLRFGNDPINWAVDSPTAGRPSSSALQDTDGDGIPDQWEMDYGFSPTNPTDAAGDPDRDGVSNLGEYVSGTSPTNATSVLRMLDVIPSADTNIPYQVRFLAYSNATYTVEYRNSLLPTASWRKLGDVLSAPSNRIVEVSDPTAYEKADRYYRIVAPATD